MATCGEHALARSTGRRSDGPSCVPATGITASAAGALLPELPQDATIAACARAAAVISATLTAAPDAGYDDQTYPCTWYAFDWGGTRFYILDGAWAIDGCLPGRRQRIQTVRSQAARSVEPSSPGSPTTSPVTPRRHRFAFWHYPLYADSSSQGSDWFLDGPENLKACSRPME